MTNFGHQSIDSMFSECLQIMSHSNPVAELIGQRLGVELSDYHLTQAFEVGSFKPGKEALGQGGSRSGGEA